MHHCPICIAIASLIVVGCSATPDLTEFRDADSLSLRVDDDPSVWHAQTEIARVDDTEKIEAIVAILSKYDRHWRPVPFTPPWPPATLVANGVNETTDVLFLAWPISEATVYAQKRIDGDYYSANLAASDVREILTLMNAPEAVASTED